MFYIEIKCLLQYRAKINFHLSSNKSVPFYSDTIIKIFGQSFYKNDEIQSFSPHYTSTFLMSLSE